jgi:hypothetical protein
MKKRLCQDEEWPDEGGRAHAVSERTPKPDLKELNQAALLPACGMSYALFQSGLPAAHGGI